MNCFKETEISRVFLWVLSKWKMVLHHASSSLFSCTSFYKQIRGCLQNRGVFTQEICRCCDLLNCGKEFFVLAVCISSLKLKASLVVSEWWLISTWLKNISLSCHAHQLTVTCQASQHWTAQMCIWVEF